MSAGSLFHTVAAATAKALVPMTMTGARRGATALLNFGGSLLSMTIIFKEEQTNWAW